MATSCVCIQLPNVVPPYIPPDVSRPLLAPVSCLQISPTSLPLQAHLLRCRRPRTVSSFCFLKPTVWRTNSSAQAPAQVVGAPAPSLLHNETPATPRRPSAPPPRPPPVSAPPRRRPLSAPSDIHMIVLLQCQVCLACTARNPGPQPARSRAPIAHAVRNSAADIPTADTGPWPPRRGG